MVVVRDFSKKEKGIKMSEMKIEMEGVGFLRFGEERERDAD